MAAPAESTDTRPIFLYLGSLTLLVTLAKPDGFLFGIPASYLLKNQLHASATQVSTFWLLAGLTVYAAFVFGLARDLWNPLGWRDRGFFVLFAPITAVTFVWMARSDLSYGGLLFSVLLATLSFQFITAAQSGLIALLGQEKLMSGRLSALWGVINYVPRVVGAFASGYITAHFSATQIFTLMAALSVVISGMAFWKPLSVFNHTYEKPQARGTDFRGDVKRLVEHRAIYPAMLILLLWFFTPGLGTPMQFYLTNQLHASDAVYSYFNGILGLSNIPGYLLYGYMCKKAPLHKLLWWGTIVATPGLIPLALIHSPTAALAMATMALTWGFAHASYVDLAMRSCPPGLQGTLMMLVAGMAALATNCGDLVGSWLYNSSAAHGFMYCMMGGTITTASILPTLLLLPKELTVTPDGEPYAVTSAR